VVMIVGVVGELPDRDDVPRLVPRPDHQARRVAAVGG
jgi:hypothetical protein